MDPTTFIDPTKWIDAIVKVYKAWRGFRVIVLGTTGVGKTTLWKALETGKAVQANEIEKTTEIQKVVGGKGKFRIRNIKMMRIPVKVMALDVPGDLELRHTWKEALNAVKPQGIVFMLDHSADSNVKPTGSGYSEMRLKEHYEAFDHLRNIYLENEKLMKELRAALVLVNKSDVWPTNLNYGDIIKASDINSIRDWLQQSTKVGYRMSKCSALNNDNVEESFEWLVTHM